MPAEDASDFELAAAFLPQDLRARVMALNDFGQEMARARLIASEPTLAAIRLQWWSDTIASIHAKTYVPANPLANTLASLIETHNLPLHLFEDMIDAHIGALDSNPFADWRELEAFLDATSANVTRLCLLACGLDAESMDEIARAAGQAWGMAELMMVLPKWAARRSHWLPTDLLDAQTCEALFAGQVKPSLHDTLHIARSKIETARYQLNQRLKRQPLGPLFPIIARTCLAPRYGQTSVPQTGPNWILPASPTLLERQVRLTWAVARGRV